MFISLPIFFFLVFLPQDKCIRATSQQIQRRQAPGPSSKINTTIRSPNGTNITSNFQTKIYVQPRIVSANGLTNRGVMGERRILTCKASTAIFHHSHCQHRGDITGSLREYVVWCRSPQATVTFSGTLFPAAAQAMATAVPMEDPTLHHEVGMCAPNEVCVDSLYSVSYRNPLVLTANCVDISYFKEKLPPEDLDEAAGEIGESGELAGKTANVIVSKDDNQTPLQMHGIDLKSESGSSSGLESGGDAVILQEKNCTDCFELRTTKAFTDQTDDLKLELTLVGTGSVALTGVLWVALMTG